MIRSRRNPLIKVLFWVAAAVSGAILLLLLFLLLVFTGLFGPLPGRQKLSEITNEEASLVLSSDGTIIGKFFAENRTNISANDIPDHLRNALIATEDRRYFSHSGYDSRSTIRVLIKSIFSRDRAGGGGSTLTQQLVKNLYGRRNYIFFSLPVNKTKEVIIARRLEKVFSKEELLLLYLNSVPFGESLFGVESAARRYFNKHAKELKIEESAVLVGMLKANTTYNPRLNPKNSLARRNLVLGLMQRENYLTSEVVDSLQSLPIILDYENMSLSPPAGYFVYQVSKQAEELLKSVKNDDGELYDLKKDGLKIYTSLDISVQNLATEAIKSHLTRMQKLLDKELEARHFKQSWLAKQSQLACNAEDSGRVRNVELIDWDGLHVRSISVCDSLWHYYKMLNASMLVSNPKTGAVIAWIGGNHFAKLPFDMVLSHRQIASAFKPFVYATAFGNGFTPCQYLDNTETVYSRYENWSPVNFDHVATPGKNVALWYALVHSMNLPTLDMYFRLDPGSLMNTCQSLELPLPEKEHPSMALGALDLSLYEAVRAYASIANMGVMNQMYMIEKITDSRDKVLYIRSATAQKVVFSPGTSQTITAILQEAINQGTGARIRNTYGVRSALAGKTGTSQNNSDAWFFAYTPDLVVGTWVGARSPDLHFRGHQGTGSSLALPIVAKVLKGIEGDAELREKYLTHFSIPEATYSFKNCAPYRNNTLQRIIDSIFGSQKAGAKQQSGHTQKKTPGRKKDNLFDKIFGGRD